MKYKTIHLFTFFIFLFSIGISTGKAYALPYSSTVENSPAFIATPYPTLTPIGSIPTNIPLQATADFTCPLGVPYGYGTVTPSTEWEIACGHCFPTNTPAVLSTSTLGPTHTPWAGGGTALPPICITVPAGGEECYIPTLTPAATNTPFPTATATLPAVTSTPLYTGAGMIQENLTLTNTGSPYINTVSGSASCDPVVGTNHSLFYCSGSFSANDSSGIIGGSVFYNHVFNPQWTSGTYPIYYTYSIVNSSSGTTGYTAITGTATNTNASLTGSGSYNIIGSNNMTFNLGVYSDGARTGSLSGSYELWVSLYPYDPFVPTPTPTITSTPLGGNFCDAVSNSTVPNQFGLNGSGSVVSQTCNVIPGVYFQDVIDVLVPSWLSPFTTVFNTIFPVEAGIDPVTICVRQRDFSLYVFGYRLPYEALLGLGIFLSSLRMFVPTVFAGVSALGTTKHGESSPTSTSVTRGADGSVTFTQRFKDKDK